MSKNSTENQEKIIRPPVVVVMGHVDHGKTTLLDYIRKSRVAEREAGGITQAVGAYEVEHQGKKITFIDTPGHEAFTAMRQRGATIADLAILVVASDDGVKPQTKEAIQILQDTQTPFVVALTKIDKNNADPDRAKQSLLANGVLLESLGGDVSWVEVSSKIGTGIDELLDHLLLMAEIEELTYCPQSVGKGLVLEAKRDPQKGLLVSVIIKDGTVRLGEEMYTATAKGKIRTLENFRGERVTELTVSSPARITGFEALPGVGEAFCIGMELDSCIQSCPQPYQKPNGDITSVDEKTVSIILKSDVSGSLEALTQVLCGLQLEHLKIRIVSQEVGDITDGDVKLAAATGAIIVGFNVKTNKSVQNLSRAQHVRMIVSDIIYRLIEQIQELDAGLHEKKTLGSLEVLAVFSTKNKTRLIGGKMIDGRLMLQDRFVVLRADAPIGRGRITNLQRNKMDAKRVEEGECGLMVETPVELQAGDYIIVEIEE